MRNKKAQPSARVAAAMAILKKTLPDLSAVEHMGDTIQPFALIPPQIEDIAAWQDRFKPNSATYVQPTITQASTVH